MDMLDMTTNSEQPRHPEPTDRRRLITSTVWTLLILALCLFLPAGTLAWFRGWLFFAVVVAAGVVITLYLRRVNPDVVAARVNRHKGTKGWDRWVLAPFIVAMVAVYPVAALDDGRFQWSHVPWWLCLGGYVLLLAGMAGMTWAEAVNKHFEPTVRIQTDRGHTVIDTGPYAIVRHPGYVAASLSSCRGHGARPGVVMGTDPRRHLVPALGRANDLGGPNPAERIDRLRGVHATGSIQACPWVVVAG
jgi:isoprenylcysteine carboxyl methyltransferase (ICMT) family protein YpbQ